MKAIHDSADWIGSFLGEAIAILRCFSSEASRICSG